MAAAAQPRLASSQRGRRQAPPASRRPERRRTPDSLLPPGLFDEEVDDSSFCSSLPSYSQLGRPRLLIEYCWEFKFCALISAAGVGMWSSTLLLLFSAGRQTQIDSSKVVTRACSFHVDDCRVEVQLMLGFFALYFLQRAALFLPPVGAVYRLRGERSRRIRAPALFSRRWLCSGALRLLSWLAVEGPWVAFGISLFIAWFKMARRPSCDWRSWQLYFNPHFQGFGVLCFSRAMARWQSNLILGGKLKFLALADRQPSRKYDPKLFGSDDGCPYPAECVICLSAFEHSSNIKVTQCQHAFHRDCLVTWTSDHTSCPVCRGELRAVTSCKKGKCPAHGGISAVAEVSEAPPEALLEGAADALRQLELSSQALHQLELSPQSDVGLLDLEEAAERRGGDGPMLPAEQLARTLFPGEAEAALLDVGLALQAEAMSPDSLRKKREHRGGRLKPRPPPSPEHPDLERGLWDGGRAGAARSPAPPPRARPPERAYLVDNSGLNTGAEALCFRRSKDFEDRTTQGVRYGSTVTGTDEGDGWLKVGKRFLPMTVSGVTVLFLQDAGEGGETGGLHFVWDLSPTAVSTLEVHDSPPCPEAGQMHALTPVENSWPGRPANVRSSSFESDATQYSCNSSSQPPTPVSTNHSASQPMPDGRRC